MIRVNVPGIGRVKVDEKDLQRLEQTLTESFSKAQKQAIEREEDPKRLRAAVQGLGSKVDVMTSHLVKIEKAIGKLKTEVNVPAPIVNIPAPVVKSPEINIPAPVVNIPKETKKPVKKVVVTDVERDYEGNIEECVFEVVR